MGTIQKRKSTAPKNIKYMLDGVSVFSLFEKEHSYNLCIKRYKQGMDLRDAVESVLNGVDNRKNNHGYIQHYYKGIPIARQFKCVADRAYYYHKYKECGSQEKAYRLTIKNKKRREKEWEDFYREKLKNEQRFSI